MVSTVYATVLPLSCHHLDPVLSSFMLFHQTKKVQKRCSHNSVAASNLSFHFLVVTMFLMYPKEGISQYVAFYEQEKANYDSDFIPIDASDGSVPADLEDAINRMITGYCMESIIPWEGFDPSHITEGWGLPLAGALCNGEEKVVIMLASFHNDMGSDNNEIVKKAKDTWHKQAKRLQLKAASQVMALVPTMVDRAVEMEKSHEQEKAAINEEMLYLQDQYDDLVEESNAKNELIASYRAKDNTSNYLKDLQQSGNFTAVYRTGGKKVKLEVEKEEDEMPVEIASSTTFLPSGRTVNTNDHATISGRARTRVTTETPSQYGTPFGRSRTPSHQHGSPFSGFPAPSQQQHGTPFGGHSTPSQQHGFHFGGHPPPPSQQQHGTPFGGGSTRRVSSPRQSADGGGDYSRDGFRFGSAGAPFNNRHGHYSTSTPGGNGNANSWGAPPSDGNRRHQGSRPMRQPHFSGDPTMETID
jgi:hypothetical protein